MNARTHHFEALVRFDSNRYEDSLFEFMTFAEEVGIICDFDIAMYRKVLAWMKNANKADYKYMAAVNISGCSLSTPVWRAELVSRDYARWKSP